MQAGGRQKPERSSTTLCDSQECALLVGGRLRSDRDVRFQSADISMVERRSHVPARSHPSVDCRGRLRSEGVDRPSHINVRRVAAAPATPASVFPLVGAPPPPRRPPPRQTFPPPAAPPPTTSNIPGECSGEQARPRAPPPENPPPPHATTPPPPTQPGTGPGTGPPTGLPPPSTTPPPPPHTPPQTLPLQPKPLTDHPLTSGRRSILSCVVSSEGGAVMGMGHPQTLVGFMEMYPTQDACRRALFEQRWREGFRCPRCAHEAAWYLARPRALASARAAATRRR